jgi:hypothetical protein
MSALDNRWDLHCDSHFSTALVPLSKNAPVDAVTKITTRKKKMKLGMVNSIWKLCFLHKWFALLCACLSSFWLWLLTI